MMMYGKGLHREPVRERLTTVMHNAGEVYCCLCSMWNKPQMQKLSHYPANDEETIEYGQAAPAQD